MCGAASGGALAISLACGQDEVAATKTRQFARWFAERHGAIRCADLVGLDEGSADDLVAAARELKQELCDGLVTSAVKGVMNVLRDSEELKGLWIP